MAEDEPSTEALRLEQIERERSERAHEREAQTPEGERAARRRADKASYLRSKLDEQAGSDDDHQD